MDIAGILELTEKMPRVYGVKPEWLLISPVGINGLPIPRLLLELIAQGVWDTMQFNQFPNNVFATEKELTLYGLHMMACENLYWPSENRNDFLGTSSLDNHPGTIDPAKSVLIADFGLGSDQPIALDYRESIETPKVIALRWKMPFEHNCWVEVARSFQEFSRLIGVK